MKKLFIITYEYPYGVGEQFFETEAQFLSNAYSEVVVFSINGNAKVKQTRKPPQNFVVFPLKCPKGRFRNFIKGLFASKKGFKPEHHGLKQKLLLTYYFGRKAFISNAILNTIQKHKLDLNNSILYSYWLSFGAAAITVRNRLENSGAKDIMLISRAHGYDLFWERMPCHYPALQKETIRYLDRVYSVSETGMEYLKKRYPEYSNKILYARLGTLDKGLLNNKTGLSAFSFITCSDNRPLKRLDLFASAFSKLIEKHPNVRWNAIGIDGSEKTIQQNLTQEAKRNVTFFGNLSNDKVFEIYKSFSNCCFVNVSSTEGLPVSIMEAMSFGMPIIATDVGGVKELVNKNNGFILSSNPSVDEVVLAMSNIIEENETNLKAKSKNSRERWNKLVNAETNYSNWVNNLGKL